MIGIHDMTFDAICKVNEKEKRGLLFQNIVLAGAGSLFPGIGERLDKEMRLMTDCNVKVVTPPERKYSDWVGGSILTSLGSFASQWTFKYEYDESGPPYTRKHF